MLCLQSLLAACNPSRFYADFIYSSSKEAKWKEQIALDPPNAWRNVFSSFASFALHSHVDKEKLMEIFFWRSFVYCALLSFSLPSDGLKKFTQEWPTEAIKVKIRHDSWCLCFKKQKSESNKFFFFGIKMLHNWNQMEGSVYLKNDTNWIHLRVLERKFPREFLCCSMLKLMENFNGTSSIGDGH